MPPPRYRPRCNYGACRNQTTGESAPATTYVVGANAEPIYVCGACAHKMAQKLGLEPKKTRPKAKRKARAGA